MGQALLGIEIGNCNIKAVQGIQKRNELVLTNYGIEPTPKGAVWDGFIMDMDALLHSLENLLKRKHFTEKNTAIMVQGTSVITRNVLMPPMGEKELRMILDYKKDDYFLIDVSDYQTDFKILNEVETEEGKMLNVLLVAVPNIIIKNTLELIKRLNLKPKFIDIASNALSKIFASRSFGFYNEKFSIMILDLGGQTTTVTILSEGHILFSRSILYGLEQLKEFMRDEFEGNDLVASALEEQMIQEINRFLEFYYSRSNVKKIKIIYLVGGGAYFKNIAQYIENMLDIPVKPADVFEDIVIKDISGFDKDFFYLVNALGLIKRT
ncbi:type IV pilus assembly protein PilM [Defluviitalea raffinosedens]|jgi:type IV pilus assembly protein PilM|uniref:Type IV pilus assembly protein PilM n=1 Tax=Defluviitalea raffinosedens TaxID=1450156 RepID=A0A7C8HJQ3_9FIRM|nr:type IV pilus assembly protein PilM [Defluviitalea raffinosedens]KAE9637251.1 type IV pilus assembly protein PilM [Defluviitalea raffinosedens]MBM7685552.1 type IV pilus assembly protein PilM [Defluviitalea raffinosedens]HHW66719.1 type IV pilus assembly protein PilM [Candidatus Epulonipiscium sp.]